jgi:predicted PurR-regulated permease PerM
MVGEMALVLLFLVLIVFIILLIPAVLELRKTLSKISNLAETLNKDLPEILENIRDISENANNTTEKLNNVVSDVAEFEKKISNEIKEPALEAAANIAGLIQGIQTFVTYFVKKKK